MLLSSFCVDFQPTDLKVKFPPETGFKWVQCYLPFVAKVMIKKHVNWSLASCVCSLSPVSSLRGGTSSAGRPATCTSSQGTSLGSWSCGSLECIFPAPPPPSASPSLAVSCRCWCHGSSPWACAASHSYAAVQTAGAWRQGPFSAACPGFGHSRGGVAGGWPDRRWPFPGESWPLTGSRSWRWRARWRRCRSHPRRRPCGSCSSSRTEGRTNVLDHLEGERSTEGANIRSYAEQFSLPFLSFRANNREEKNETLAQREAQIS